MKADRRKLEMAMARACITPNKLAQMAEMPRPTLNNAIAGKSVRPATLGRIARALNCDPADLIEQPR